MATEVSDGSGPKPIPITITSSSNDSGVMLSARHARVMTAAVEISSPDHGQELVVPHAAEHLAGEPGAGVERHHEHHQAQPGVGRREPHHACR